MCQKGLFLKATLLHACTYSFPFGWKAMDLCFPGESQFSYIKGMFSNNCSLQFPVGVAVWAKAFRDLKSPETTPTPDFPGNPPGISTEFILSAMQNPLSFPELSWIFPNSPNFPLFRQGFRPPPRKIHSQNRRHSSPISHSWTQKLFTSIFCLPGRPKDFQLGCVFVWNYQAWSF